MSKLILASVVIGLVLGKLLGGRITIPSELEFAAFSVMLFGIGLELGQDKALWQRLRTGGWKMILFPLTVVVGSWIGGMAAGLVLGLGIRPGAGVSLGMGWYSMDAVLMNQFDGPKLAAIAFLANVLRELLSFILIPWVARFGNGWIAVAVGGATSMDTTLPLITRHTNPQMAMYGFVSGVVCSSLVPVLIPIWMRL